LIFFILNLKKNKTKNNLPLILLSIQGSGIILQPRFLAFTKEVSVDFFILNLENKIKNNLPLILLSIQGFRIIL